MIHFILGTKAQLIKTAPVMKELQQRGIRYNFIATGQHRATMDEILNNFGIKSPDIYLYQGPDITGILQMLRWALGILFYTLRHKKNIFQNDTNGIVLVHGDTFSTLLGALMGKLAGLKVGHIESGLRSYNLFHPFPEEITRILVFRLADVMFCADQQALDNLQGIAGIKVNTGANTLYDAVQQALPVLEQIEDVDIPRRSYAIVTLHRFENFRDEASVARIMGLVELISRNKTLLFILHKPTELALKRSKWFKILMANPRIETRARYDYFRFLKLLIHADFVVSDGGSNQEECYYLGKPILLLRKTTERSEGIGQNCVLSGFETTKIEDFLANTKKFERSMKILDVSPSSVIVEYLKVFTD